MSLSYALYLLISYNIDDLSTKFYYFQTEKKSFNLFPNFIKLLVINMKVHIKCRGSYPGLTDLERFKFPDDKVSWKVKFADYKPVKYTAPVVLNKPVWADPDIDEPEFKLIKFNTIDGKVNRKSHEGEYEVVDGVPLNIRGRTGMIGRGLLGRWGPNHAADPIVTR